jgi:hypothetical protein
MHYDLFQFMHKFHHIPSIHWIELNTDTSSVPYCEWFVSHKKLSELIIFLYINIKIRPIYFHDLIMTSAHETVCANAPEGIAAKKIILIIHSHISQSSRMCGTLSLCLLHALMWEKFALPYQITELKFLLYFFFIDTFVSVKFKLMLWTLKRCAVFDQ